MYAGSQMDGGLCSLGTLGTVRSQKHEDIIYGKRWRWGVWRVAGFE